MIFLKLKLAPWIFSGFALALLFVWWREKGFFAWIRLHWFVKRSPWQWLGGVFLAAGLGMLSVVLLDPRSGEIKVKGKIRQDRTIILIDTSTSMLVEDVRPNRLEKAVLLAKHFVRKAVGHQVAVMVFADITKKLVPFTTDTDLLDARIDSVKLLRNLNAGSSIGLAIEEAVRFFNPQDKSVSGNVLVITDGEDNADTERFKVPEGVSLVLEGVGPAEGGPIPMKDSMGFHHGNKKDKGETVISKLNEGFFNQACSGLANCQHYIAKSYDLPTEQILDFMGRRKAAEREGDNLVRPVAMSIWAVPGLLLMLLGIVLRSLRPFVMAMLCLSLVSTRLDAKEKEVELSPQLLQRLEQLRKGELDRDEKINLADQLVKEKSHALAQKIYQEQLTPGDIEAHPNSYFNWATSELESKNLPKALEHYDQLERGLKKDDPTRSELLSKMRENIRRAVAMGQQKQDQKNKDQKDQEQKDQEKKDQSGEKNPDQKQGEGKEGEGQQKPGEGKDEQQQKDGKNPFDTKNEEKKEQKNDPGDNKKDPQEKKDDGDEEKKGDLAQGEGEGEKKPRPKVSPLLEQLKQDDRKLQLKLLDVSTQKRVQGRKKDW